MTVCNVKLFSLYSNILYFSWDINLPVYLDFEIWKTSNMLFQPIPNTRKTNTGNNEWDDTWHKITYPTLPSTDKDCNHDNIDITQSIINENGK